MVTQYLKQREKHRTQHNESSAPEYFTTSKHFFSRLIWPNDSSSCYRYEHDFLLLGLMQFMFCPLFPSSLFSPTSEHMDMVDIPKYEWFRGVKQWVSSSRVSEGQMLLEKMDTVRTGSSRWREDPLWRNGPHLPCPRAPNKHSTVGLQNRDWGNIRWSHLLVWRCEKIGVHLIYPPSWSQTMRALEDIALRADSSYWIFLSPLACHQSEWQ